MTPSTVCLLIALIASCSAGVKTMTTPLPKCTTRVACDSHDNERVEIIGVYSVWDPRVGVTSEATRSRHVIVALEGTHDGPFLEAGSDPRHKRSPEEIARFRDKQVRVVGRFVRQMPQRDDDSAQLGGACISDIESITIAE